MVALSVSCSARNLFRSLGFKFRKMMNCNCMNLPTSYGSGRMIYPQFCQQEFIPESEFINTNVWKVTIDEVLISSSNDD